jgi:hypothetical protein
MDEPKIDAADNTWLSIQAIDDYMTQIVEISELPEGEIVKNDTAVIMLMRFALEQQIWINKFLVARVAELEAINKRYRRT